MDISETYIDMSDCPDIQLSQKPLVRGNWYVRKQNHSFLLVRDGAMLDTPHYSWIWLPLQDQLQNMMDLPLFDLLSRFSLFVFSELSREKHERGQTDMVGINSYSLQFTTPVQLWLAFVMKERYGKVWSNSEWIKP